MIKYFIYFALLFYSISFSQTRDNIDGDDYGDRLKIGYVRSGELSFNPLQINSEYDQEFAELVYGNGLFTRNDSGKYVTNMALEYKPLSATVLRFKLRPNLIFQDGSVITAEDVKLSYELYKKFSSQSQQLFNAKFISSIETYGTDIVRIRLTQPLPDFTHTIGTLPVLPATISENLLKYDSISDLPDVDPVGFGYFVLADYKKNMWVKLDAFSTHTFGKSYLDGIDFMFYESQDLLLDAFLRDEVDLIQIHDKSEIQKIKQFSKEIIQLKDRNRTLYYINLNTRTSPFKDFGIRRAVNHAINKEQIIQSLFTSNENDAMDALGKIYSESSKYFVPLEYKPFDALQILLNKNYKKNSQGKLIRNNKELQFDLYLRKGSFFEELIARIIAINLGEIGISVTPTSIESATIKERIFEGKYQAVLKKFNFDPGEENFTIRNFYMNELSNINGFQNFKNLSFDLLIDYINSNQNGDNIQDVPQKFQNLLNRYNPCIFLFIKDTDIYAINPRFENILMSGTNNNSIVIKQFKPKDEWFVKKVNHKY